jgi:hypothetical protein
MIFFQPKPPSNKMAEKITRGHEKLAILRFAFECENNHPKLSAKDLM